MAVVTVKWAKTGQLLDKSTVHDAVNKAAEKIAAGARDWGEEHRVTGAYADGIEVEEASARDGRPVARVKATAPHSAAVEYGTARAPAQAPMRVSAQKAGFRLKPRGR